MLILFFILFHASGLYSRWDQTVIINVKGGGSRGSWGKELICPEGSWVKGFRHKTDTNAGILYDDVGTISVEVSCFDLSKNKVATLTTVPLDDNDDTCFFEAYTWSNYVECSYEHNFITGVNQKVGDQSIAVTGVTVSCADSIELIPGYDHSEGSYNGYSYCPVESAICGIKSKFDSYGSVFGDDTALNDLIIYCCRTCDQASGRYIDTSTIECKICHYTCKTCNGGSSLNCLSCYHSGTPISNACPSPSYLYEVEGSSHSPSGWTGYPSTTLSDCGSFITGIFGGYNIFGKDGYAQKSYSSLPPHFKKRIRVRFVKIDSWDSEIAYVYLDSTQIMSKTFINNDGLLSGSSCGIYSLDYDYVLETELTNSLQSFFIKITTNLNELADNESWGFSDFYLGILKCDSTCASCSDQNPNSCSTCYPNASPTSGVCSCNDCYYMVITSNCVSAPCSSCPACYTGCKKCTGSNIGDCQSCISDYYFYSGTCYYKHCPASTFGNNATLTCDDSCNDVSEYIDLTDRICKTCDPTCLTCSEKLNTNCRSCLPPRFLSIETPNTDGQCINPCISPKFAHFPTRKCWTICPLPTWGRSSDRICYDNCLTTLWYKDLSDRICKNCHSSCLTCSGPLDSDCLSCWGTFYLYGGNCLSDCGEGKYGDSITNTCKNCNTNCKSCMTPNQPTTCTTCYPPKVLKNNQCANSCDANQYIDYISQSCKSCHDNCLECFGSGTSECTSCQNPKLLNEETNECQQTCSAPFYKYDYSQKCVKTCPGNLYGNNSTRSCDLNCANLNEFKDDSDNICKPCHYTCLKCSGPSSSNCLTCALPLFLKDTTCVLDCGLSFYGSNIENICYTCSGKCLSCNTPDSCLSCGSPYFLESSSCVFICPVPLWGISESKSCQSTCLSSLYYEDPIDRICKPCKYGCLTCDNTGCITCPSDRYLSNKECLLSICPKGFFFEVKNGVSVCVSCQEKEEYRKTKLECQQTPSYYIYQNKCIRKCPSKTYEMYLQQYAICNQCPDFCFECSYPGINCTRCVENTFLYAGMCLTVCPAPLWGNMSKEIWVCQQGCEKGFFTNEINRTCLLCNKDCATCSGPLSYDCLTCPSGFFMNSDGKCLPCEIPCIGCNVRGDNCTKCLDTMKLYPQTENTNSCMTKFCDPNCDACAQDNICNKCISEDYFLKNISLKERVCQAKKRITCNLLEVNNPRLFELRFSDSWDTLLSEIANKTSISISKLDPKTYNCSLTRIREHDLSFFINCNYSTNVTNESAITLKINDYVPKSDPSTEFYLASDYMMVNLRERVICNGDTSWKESIQKCEAPVQITPFIRLTNDPLVINYGFDKPIPEELDRNISLNTQISIPSLNSSDYTVKISKSANSNNFIYNIEVTSEKEIKDNPILKVDLSLSPSLKSYENLTFTKTLVEINLMDYYVLLPESKQAVENSAELVKGSTIGADQGFVYSNVIRTGSSFMIKSLIVNQMIHLMRFINIKYPPNVLGIFKSKLGRASFFPEFEVEADLEDGIPDGTYYQHNISPYVLNNCGTFLLTCYAFLLIAIIFNFIEIFLGQYLRKSRAVLKIYGIIYDFFVWNFPISFLMSKYLTVTLLVGVAMRYPTYKTVKGTLNLFLATFTATLVILFPLLILLIIRKIRSSAVLVSVMKPFKEITATNERKSYNFLLKNKEKELDETPVTNKEDQRDSPEKDVTFSPSFLSNLESPESPSGKLEVENLEIPNRDNIEDFTPYTKPVESNLEQSIRENNPLIEDSPDSKNKELSIKDKDVIIEKAKGVVNQTLKDNPMPTEIIIAENTQQEAGIQIFVPNIQSINSNKNIDDDKINEQAIALTAKTKLGEDSNHLKKEIEVEIMTKENKMVDAIPKENNNDKVIQEPPKEIFIPLSLKNNAKLHKPNLNTWKGFFKSFKKRRINLVMIWSLILNFFKKNQNDSMLRTLKDKKKSYSTLLEPTPSGSISKGLDKLKRNFEVLHKEFSLERPFNHYFMFFEIMRQLLFTLIILCFEYRPLLQTVLINLLNIFFFALIITFKPFAKMRVFIQNCIVESLLILTNLGFLILAILDTVGNRDFEVRMNVGWWICITNMAIILFMLLMLLVQIMTIIWPLIVKSKSTFQNRRSNKISFK